MKKNFVKVLISTVFTFFICSSLFAENARVTYVKGKAEVLRENSWVQLSAGDTLNKADVISTGFQSEVKIEYGGSIMALGALTRITLENLSTSEKKDNVSVYLNTGAVRSKVTHTQEKRVAYNVKTPVAVASVRGTDFTMRASGTVTCHEGAVVVYPSFNRIAKNANIKDFNKAEETEETEGSSDEEIGDNGPATPTTPADEISDGVPAGAFVVGQDQTVSINPFGNTDTPMQHADKELESVKTQVAVTAASMESVSVSGAAGIDGFTGVLDMEKIPNGDVNFVINLKTSN